jgi:hypothetical protein
MKRIGWILTLATAVALGSSAMSQAATHTKQHGVAAAHVQATSNAACPVSNPALCGGSCPRGATATTTAAAASVQKMNGVNCPVSDPSKCPASCRRTGAATTTAVAAITRH